MDDHHWFIAGLYAFVGVEGLHKLEEADKRNGLPSKSSVKIHLSKFNDVLDCDDVTGRGVARTDAGHRIEDTAKELLTDLDARIRRAREHLSRLGQANRPVTIAMSPTIWMWGAEPGKLPLRNSLPGHAPAEFLVANSARVEKVVRDGLFEIGITAGQPNGRPANDAYDIELFGKDEIVVLVPPDHEWAGRTSLTAEDLTSSRLITLDITANARQVVETAMWSINRQLAAPLEEVATTELVIEEALHAKQPALVPKLALGTPQGREAQDQGFLSKGTSDLALSREFHLIFQKPKMLRPEAREALDELRKLQFPG